ncbi:deoxyribodipyrimidine photo-lyase [Hasllibacter halocynthiae]|uniref:Deoxyribodipyrimidine photo-lyase n=1 Tax=Hasllibacter halocynthiae TaxID=595589 RepID=A0A2T0X7D5_9RHOB|nr:FAD-binding domain-containing protein [Hasllibacter halocynthiae]PRY94846.1 deoxyribodipyrimidine photo-lyase [Hasllibacter halocynthiae]
MLDLSPTRAAGLERLQAFAPEAGRAYATGRNADDSENGYPAVSVLSPWLRHRLVTEAEVLDAVLARHAPDAAAKFVSEVHWRTYFKGFMELRPSLWAGYGRDVRRQLDRVQAESGLRSEWEAACKGETGYEAFDHWARELVETGYVHNHARMWFASLWTHTLGLPWELGADFFIRHLLDGDAASNTLSWRWVVGLHTEGRTYLARNGNITRYTNGRFEPDDRLAGRAEPAGGMPNPPPGAPPQGDDWSDADGVLIHEDDLWADHVLPRMEGAPTAVLLSPEGRSPLRVAPKVLGWTRAAAEDAMRERGIAARWLDGPEEAAAWARTESLAKVVTPYAPAGPAADALRAAERSGLPLVRALRSYDARAWPKATAGFFKLKKAIPALTAHLPQRGAA